MTETAASRFVAGLDLAESFYWEAVRPIVDSHFPGVPHSASLIGYGSDVLGYDTERSTDHNWGPRLQLFLADEEYARLALALNRRLRTELPHHFRGYSVSFSAPDLADNGTQHMEAPTGAEVNHLVEIDSPAAFFRERLGIDACADLGTVDWLLLSEQDLLELTAGRVFHDGLGTLTELRAKLAYYPDPVWRYRMASQWQRISQEEPFVGRCGEVGDDLGSRLVAARLVRDLMRLAFLQERRYAPYSKWLGTAFAHLSVAAELGPLLMAALEAGDWQAREQQLSRAYVLLAEQHNRLGITDPVDPAMRRFFGRPFLVIFAERFARALTATLEDPSLRRIGGLYGGADQFVDSTDFTSDPKLMQRLISVYE